LDPLTPIIRWVLPSVARADEPMQVLFEASPPPPAVFGGEPESRPAPVLESMVETLESRSEPVLESESREGAVPLPSGDEPASVVRGPAPPLLVAHAAKIAATRSMGATGWWARRSEEW
jgi:hypothetical protein